MVDDKWITDPTAPEESDGSDNINNVLLPEHISKTNRSRNQQDSDIMSGVTLQSTTADLAGNVPKESSRGRDPSAGSSQLPGTFPGTPDHEASSFSVKPIPEASGIGNPINLAPGEEVPDPSTLTSNTISSTARDDPSLKSSEDSQQTFGVSPLPPTSGISNPIHLRPGEKVPSPSTFTSNTINTAVTTDESSFNKSSGAPQLPNVVTPDDERKVTGGLFNLPGISGAIIPESGSPRNDGLSDRDPDMTIQSAGPKSTTAALAGSVPLEPRGVPEVIPENQQNVGKSYEERDPGATIQSAGPQSTTAGLAGKVPLEPRSVPDSYQSRDPGTTIQSAGPDSTTAALAGNVPLESKGVPQIVQESQIDAGFAPEASANTEAVKEKKTVEDELESKVPEEPATSEGTGRDINDRTAGLAAAGTAAGVGAVAVGAATTETTLGNSTSLPSRGLPASVQQSINEINQGTPIAPTVPDIVQQSISESHQSPEAAASNTLVSEKSAVEAELLKEVKTENAVGEPAPSSSTAFLETAPAAGKTPVTGSTTATNGASGTTDVPKNEPMSTTSPGRKPAIADALKNRTDSRDISPMSHPVQPSQTGPSVTTGVGTSSAPQVSKPDPAPSSSTARPIQATSEASASSDKKSKRASGFFGKLRSKFSDKDKKQT